MEEIKLPAWEPKLKEGLQWVQGNMQFHVPLSSIAALNEMWSAVAILRNREDVFQHTLKRRVGNAIKQGDLLKTLLMHYMREADVMDVFTDHIVDVTADDVKSLRDCLREKMEANGVKEAELVAWVETARLLLVLAVHHFNMVMIRARQKFDYDYAPHFRKLRMDGVRDAWHMVANTIDPMPELTAEDDVMERLKVISLNYDKGAYLKECIRLMGDHPAFEGVMVEVEKMDAGGPAADATGTVVEDGTQPSRENRSAPTKGATGTVAEGGTAKKRGRITD